MTFFRVYRYKDQLIVPTVVQAEEGFYMDVEPLTISAISDQKSLRSNLLEALARENPVVPTPDPSEDRGGSAILERLNLRKWRAFEKDATMFTIYFNENGWEFYSTGKAVDGEWKSNRGKHISLPGDTSADRIVDLLALELSQEAVSEDEQQARATPGGLMLLPPPTDL